VITHPEPKSKIPKTTGDKKLQIERNYYPPNVKCFEIYLTHKKEHWRSLNLKTVPGEWIQGYFIHSRLPLQVVNKIITSKNHKLIVSEDLEG